MVLVLMGFVVMMNPVASHEEDDPFTTDLVTGRKHDKVGEVHVWSDADYIYVKYVITETGWYITETHLSLHVTWVSIPQTKSGNPIPGQFEYKNEHDYVTSYMYMIPNEWDHGETVDIAAHAVVKTKSPLDALEEMLPETATAKVYYPYTGGPAYFPTVVVTGDPDFAGTYQGWCIDTDRVIYQKTNYEMIVYSSYEELPAGIVDYPENLDLVNWIINQNFVGQPAFDYLLPDAGNNGLGEPLGTYTYGDVQKAIWILVEENPSASGLGPYSMDRVREILYAAYANGNDYEPGDCEEDKVAVILVPTSGNRQITIAQITFIEVGIPCVPEGDETAWGYGTDFPGANWAMWFSYTIQEETPVEWPIGGTISVAYEDLPLCGGNDWDYNDFVVDIDTLATYLRTSTDMDLIQMDITFRPEAKIAGFTHKMYVTIPDGTFGCDGTYTLTRDDVEVESGDYIDTSDLKVLIVPNTGDYPDEVVLSLFFDEEDHCHFEFPTFYDDHYHGEDLFFDPWIYVNNNGQEVHTGDPRLVTVPTDWQWPTPDATRIWWVYPDVGATTDPCEGPLFTESWWENYEP